MRHVASTSGGQYLLLFVSLAIALVAPARWIAKDYPRGALAVAAAAIVLAIIAEFLHRRRVALANRAAALVRPDHLHRAGRAFEPMVREISEIVVGHDTVIEGVCQYVRNSLLLAVPGRPLGSVLLAGPTGTGKSLLASEVAKRVFPERSPVRIDCALFQDANSVTEILGTEDHQGVLLREFDGSPYRVVVLDEVDRAHRSVHDALLALLERGRLRDRYTGIEHDMSGTLFIGTTNQPLRIAGSESVGLQDSRIRQALVSGGVFGEPMVARWHRVCYMPLLSQEPLYRLVCRGVAQLYALQGVEVEFVQPDILVNLLEQHDEHANLGVRHLESLLTDVLRDAVIAAGEAGFRHVRVELDDGALLIIGSSPTNPQKRSAVRVQLPA